MNGPAAASLPCLLLAAAGWALCAAWVWRALAGSRSLRAAPRIFPRPAPAEAPFVSVLVPARNEASNIAACLGSLGAQEYPAFEVIAVDDNSRDRTFELMQSAARAEPRIVPLRAPPTPPGWLGKCAALAFGAGHARGQWLLFTDADTVHRPQALASAMRHAVERRLDLLSLLPRATTGNFFEGVVQPATMGWYGLWFPLAEVNSPHRAAAFANGQFLLIRRTAYERIGGHAAVRTFFMEDLAIARAAKQLGLKIECARGKRIFSVRMYDSVAGYWRGWRRIFTHSFHSRWQTLIAKAAEVALLSVAPPVLLVAALVWGLAQAPSAACITAVAGCGLATALSLLFAGKSHSMVGAPVAPFVLHPLAGALITAVLLDAARVAATGARTSWR